MEQRVSHKGAKYLKKRRFRKFWHKVMMTLSSVVVFCTVYALILPAITLEKECQIPEHVHTDACYTQVLTAGNVLPVCAPDSLDIHRHEAGCYDSEGHTVCGYRDFVLHDHDENCYGENGDLWCPLPEVEEHTHGDNCYTWPQFHTHSESCYRTEQETLYCGLHQHEDTCWEESTRQICELEETDGHHHGEACLELTDELICGQEESEGHHHGEDCLELTDELICGLEENEGHHHGEACLELTDELICGLEENEGHHHGEACLELTDELICGQEESEGHHHGEACLELTDELICGQEENEGHQHGDACLDENGETICGLEEREGHQHSDTCRARGTEPACGLEESDGHRHSDTCRARGTEPACGLEESDGHHHSDACRARGTEPACGLEESDGHHHSDACRARGTEPVCGLEESDGHKHSDDCCQTVTELICGENSDHIHTDECYSTTEEPICGLEEPPAGATPERELTCGKEEIILHRHEDSCFDAAGNLVCGRTEVLRHQHGESCFVREMIPVDTDKLTCTIPEGEGAYAHGDGCYDEAGNLTCLTEETAGHQHTAHCFGIWELTCQQQEHTHNEECSPGEMPAETEVKESVPAETEVKESVPAETEVKESVPAETEVKESVPAETEAATIPEESAGGTVDTDLPLVGSSGLPVMGSAYAASNSTVDPDESRFRDLEGVGYTLWNWGARNTTPVDVTPYISGAVLQYQVGDQGEDNWQNVSGAEDIPGDANFKLTVSYAEVPIADLLKAGCAMSYTLPELFRDATAEGVIKDAFHREIGTISTSGSTATIVFQQQWLEEQQQGTNTVIGGDFYVKGKANLSQIPDGGEQEIVIGGVHITVDFAGDLLAQYGNVDIEKTVEPTVVETDAGDYLRYTLTVVAGPDGCPDVSVEDIFTQGSQHIARNDANQMDILVVSPENANVMTDADKMTWTVGDMEPNETRTLIYHVKLAEGYTGIMPNSDQSGIQNTAAVYSKTYERDTDTANFIPSAKGTLSKIGSNITTNADGSLTITYYVWINALADNSYTLDNVKLVDALDGIGNRNNATDPTIRNHLAYIEESFQLYSGGAYEKTDLNGLIPLDSAENALAWGADSNGDGKRNDSFTYYVGSLAPGESKTLVYQVHLEPGVFVAAGNNGFMVKNRAEIKTDDSRPDGNQWLNGWSEQNSFNRKAWSRKLVGSELNQSETIPMVGNVYNTDGAAVANPGSFIAPAGSYRYQVIANEAGDWDLSSASLKDTLGQYMQFVGYVRVDTYNVDSDAPASSLEDSNVIAYFQQKTPHSTFWLQVDGTNSFTVSPELDSALEDQAYLLTYYAKPVNTEDITQVLVTNEFAISGTVGIGGYQYTLTGIYANADVTVSGTNSFHAEKQAWYYEAPKTNQGDFAKGALYWAVKVNGNLIPRGTAIRDVANGNEGYAHYVRGPSLAGVYKGNLGEAGVCAYEDFAQLLSGSNLAALESTAYTVDKNNDALTVTLAEDLRLESGQSLYIIIKTEPASLPQWDRDAYTFNNKLQSSSDGTNWLDHGVAQKVLYGSENIFKELGQVFTYSGTGTETKLITYGTGAAIHAGHLTGAGTYVGWQIHLNYEGTLDGTYRVLEQIPEGMEVAYIRTYWLGGGALNQNPWPGAVPITDLGPEWEHHTKVMSSANGIDYTTHYYVNGQQVILEYQNLYPGGERDEYAVEIQVVCKLTDPDVLLGGATKDFNNVAKLIDSDGREVGSDTHGVTLSAPKMSKSKDNTVTVSGGKYPFVITLNELGTDLLPTEESITLVDELGENLIIDTASIRVKNTNTGAELTDGWNASVENDGDGTQTLRILLPDDVPLTVTYTVTVNAPPGEKVTVTNDAHWEGYTSSEGGGSVNDSEFSYEAGGTAGAATTPRITVHKIDQYNTRVSLPNAVFSLTEMQLQGNTLVEKPGGTHITDMVTDEEGLLTFGNTSDQLLAYNTVYRIQETQAPTGYVLDAKPQYVLVAQKVTQENGTSAYPDFSAYRAAGVYVSYAGPSYTFEAKNHKGEIQVQKQFASADGSPVGSLNGTYKFGLFTDREGTQKVQETYVTYAYGNPTVSAKFTNVELDTTYYIYELDDRDQPIVGGAGTVNGIPFVVSSSAESIIVTAESYSASVTVTNRMNYAELPDTGGIGTGQYTSIGMLLIITALCLLYLQHRRRKEESVSS